MTHSDVVKHLAADGSQPMTQSPAEFGTFMRGEIARWQQVADAAGIRAR
jgi:tripartite-type tricarboxylate transporter receptor subunit TctC